MCHSENSRESCTDSSCDYPGCAKSVWQDPDGSYSLFCGISHRDAMGELLDEKYVCKNCNRPSYIEGSRVHDFCGRRCAMRYHKGRRSTAADARRWRSSGPTTCELKGCNRRVYIGPYHDAAEYCSKSHRRKAVENGEAEACLHCCQYPKNLVNGKRSDFCSRKCSMEAMGGDTLVLQVPSTDNNFERVRQLFYTHWRHPSCAPNVIKIWKIFHAQDRREAFARYRQSVERRTDYPSGNTAFRFHGTVRGCKLGDTDRMQVCDSPSCCLCSIIQNGFEKERAGERMGFKRFGDGIYTSATSSKANDYVLEHGGSPYKAMLLNEVVMGNIYRLSTNNPDLTEPPLGYDSIVGEPGEVLNYDETVVYKNEAVIPLYLIVYKEL